MSRANRLLLTLCSSAICIATLSVHAATIIVTNSNDSGPGSLRGAIATAGDGDTIQFDPALKGQAIMLTSGELFVNNNITISGPGANMLTVTRELLVKSYPIRSFLLQGTSPPKF